MKEIIRTTISLFLIAILRRDRMQVQEKNILTANELNVKSISKNNDSKYKCLRLLLSNFIKRKRLATCSHSKLSSCIPNEDEPKSASP